MMPTLEVNLTNQTVDFGTNQRMSKLNGKDHSTSKRSSERSRSSSSSPCTTPDPGFRLDQDFASTRSFNTGDAPNEQLEADKKLIHNHPLFPLLGFFLEKCDTAIQSTETDLVDSLHSDVRIFLEQKKVDNERLDSDNDEVNELMILALQMLRIHLHELVKVQELSKDFCSRYIACLKGKMQSDILLRSDYGGYESDESSNGGGGSSGSRSTQGQAQAVTQLQYFPPCNNPPFMMGPVPGTADSWIMMSPGQPLQQPFDDKVAPPWQMVCKNTAPVDHHDLEPFLLFPDTTETSDKCVSKLSSLPSHYSNQFLVHHQLTQHTLNQGKSHLTNDTDVGILESLSSAFLEDHNESPSSTNSLLN